MYLVYVYKDLKKSLLQTSTIKVVYATQGKLIVTPVMSPLHETTHTFRMLLLFCLDLSELCALYVFVVLNSFYIVVIISAMSFSIVFLLSQKFGQISGDIASRGT